MTASSHTDKTMLVVNCGSTSMRLASFTISGTDSINCTASVHRTPRPESDAQVLREFLQLHALATPDVVIHRVVHGGSSLTDTCVIDDEVEKEIERLTILAPIHNRVALDWIHTSRQAFENEALQVACFDTGFYNELPQFVQTYPLPNRLRADRDIRRFGFHGLAHQSLLRQWQHHGHGQGSSRVISLQLGGGCSVTASDHGRPVETSMGFSPLGGVMMPTRCGDLDPALVLHLIEEAGFTPQQLRSMFYSESGLRGVSGESGEMKSLLESDTADADLAVSIFCHQLRLAIGGYTATLGGADAIVFGGGIGENAPEIRSRVLEHLEWAGIHLEAGLNESNQSGARHIHAPESAVELWVIPTDEARVMAELATSLINQSSRSPATTARTRP